MPARLSRNALLVKYFAQVYRIGIPRKYLVKFIYEADVLAREYLGRPLSQLTYRWDKYGPYDPAIDKAVAELIAAGHAQEKPEPFWAAKLKGGEIKRLFDQGIPVSFNFDLGESAVLDYVVTNYLNMPFKEFLEDVIYETPPMKAVTKGGDRGDLLPMEALNNTGTERVGFRLAEVLEAEAAGRRGDYVTLSAFVDELDPKLQTKAANKALAYLKHTYRGRPEFLRAVDEFRLALLNLGANPRQATGPPGLFEGRPVYRFTLEADGIPREMQLCFCYDSEDAAERTILITDFMPVGS